MLYNVDGEGCPEYSHPIVDSQGQHLGCPGFRVNFVFRFLQTSLQYKKHRINHSVGFTQNNDIGGGLGLISFTFWLQSLHPYQLRNTSMKKMKRKVTREEKRRREI